MDTLSALISLLNDEDKNAFFSFLKKKNKRNDVKNIQLFDLLKNDDISTTNKIYPTAKNKNAYHALRKRLQESLILFMSQRIFENANSEIYDILRLIVVARFLLENDLDKIAFKSLAKAEKLAIGSEEYNLLHEILLLRLQYVHLDSTADLEKLTETLMLNQQNMQVEAKLHLMYAFLRRELQEIHLKGKIVNLTTLIVTTVRKYKVSLGDLMNYKSLYHILFIANEYADIQQNYGLIEKYVRRSHEFIQRQSREVDKESNLFYHLSILYFLANFHLRSRTFTDSLGYLTTILTLIERHQRYKKRFHLRHQLLTALNFYFMGNRDNAMTILRGALSTLDRSSNSVDVEDLRVCMAMFLAQNQERESLRYLNLLVHSDAWYEKKMGMLWTIRKNLMEVLIQSQFGNLDIAISRLNSFKRRYKKYLMDIREQRVMQYVDFVQKYLDQPEVIHHASYQKSIFLFLEQNQNRDIFNVSFIAWLIALWENKTSYEVVLELIGDSRMMNNVSISAVHPPIQ